MKPLRRYCLYPQDGRGYGLENAKRQQAYEEAKGKMEALVKTDRQPLRRGRHTLLELECIT